MLESGNTSRVSALSHSQPDSRTMFSVGGWRVSRWVSIVADWCVYKGNGKRVSHSARRIPPRYATACTGTQMATQYISLLHCDLQVLCCVGNWRNSSVWLNAANKLINKRHPCCFTARLIDSGVKFELAHPRKGTDVKSPSYIRGWKSQFILLLCQALHLILRHATGNKSFN